MNIYLRACIGTYSSVKPSVKCAPRKNVTEFLKANPIQILYTDTYNDKEEQFPYLKTYINDRTHIFAGLDTRKNANFYLRRGQVTKKLLFDQKETYETYRMGPITSDEKPSNKSTKVFEATIRLDYTEVHIEKKEFGFIELLV